MNDAKIASLLAKRSKILTRRDALIDSKRIARIEAQLATVEPGRDNRVDLALGRMCAVLERYAPPPAMDDETQRLIDTTKRVWSEANPIEY